MSDINDKATITLQVNGQQAKNMLKDLEQQLDKANRKLVEMKKSGADPVAVKKQGKEVERLKRQLDQMRTAAAQVKEVMQNLDKATPRQLEKTLRTLKTQLKDLSRGSAAWDEQVAKIKKVQAQLSLVNGELRTHQSLWSRFSNFMNNGAVAIVATVAAYAATIQQLRKYVNDWATMEESIWNSVKYTRMSREEVDKLNESFKKMDTRLGREELNALAQEAGRLGKNTIKDVQEYVEAAQVINVALVDLGAGATQTIAKISNIFGIEQMYGVRDAMLKVGSTVNHLSQNCTASKPYLVNFAQRLSGIGSTAKMTVPDILAFGAVLDANGQKVEMSASAISRLIMMLFQKTGDIAKTAGMDVQKFTKVLQTDTRQGVMMFLDQLRKISNGDETTAVAKLAPLFKDLGMDGIRMSQVIATLTQHMDELNWQFGEANKAFREGKSASNEFEIFNNTAQAKIEKAKYRIHELSVELGEKLSPLMMHVTTTSTMLVKALNVAVDFFIKYKNAIAVTVVSIMAYVVALKAAVLWEKAWAAAAAVSHAGTTALRIGYVALSAVVSLLSGNFAKATKAVRVLSAAMKTTPWGLAVAAIGAVVAALVAFRDRNNEASQSQKRLSEAVNKTNTSLKSEQKEIDKAFSALMRAKKGTKEYQEAKDNIISKYGQYLQGLVNEKNELLNVEAAYMRVSNAARQAAIDRGLADAKKGVDDDFNERNSKIVDELEKQIRKYAKNQNDVNTLIQSIREEVNRQGFVGDELKKVIAGAINKGKKENSYQAVMAVVNQLEDSYKTYESDLKSTEAKFGKIDNPFLSYTEEQIQVMLDDIHDQIEQRKKDNRAARNLAKKYNVSVDQLPYMTLDRTWMPDDYSLISGGRIVSVFGTEAEAYMKEQQLAAALAAKQAERAAAEAEAKRKKDDGKVPILPSEDGGGSEKAQKDKFEKEKAWRERMLLLAKKKHAEGVTSEYQYESKLIEIDEKYYEMLLKRKDLEYNERLEFQIGAIETAQKNEALFLKWIGINDQNNYEQRKAIARQLYADGLIDKKEYDQEVESLEIEHARKLMTTTVEGTKERAEAERKLNELLIKQRERQLKEQEAHQKEVDKVRIDAFGLSEPEKQAEYEAALAILDEALDYELQLVGENEAERLRIVEKYEAAKLALKRKYNREGYADEKKHWESFDDFLKERLGENLAKVVSHGWSLVDGLMSQVSSLIQADVDQRTAQIEQEYEAQAKAAEGNSYKIAKLEKEKERKIAEAKNAANRKVMALQVIQAVAQTAQNVITAWGTGMQAGFPLGPVLAPILSSLALASGAIQIANIKKQQQAAASTGYAEGGFTSPGPKYKPAGVVHAGEWVASQRLLANPMVRPLIDAMEYVQRTNTYGSLPRSYVDNSLSAPAVLSRVSSRSEVSDVSKVLSESTSAVRDLRRRLSQPIVPVVTVTGDYGIERAQRELDKFRGNASPKSRK